MTFEWHRMESTPEGKLRKQETFQRGTATLESLASQYASQARDMLSGKDGAALTQEVSTFAEQVLSSREGFEQDDLINRLANRLRMRKPMIFDDIPDEKREQSAFVLALAQAYKHSLH